MIACLIKLFFFFKIPGRHLFRNNKGYHDQGTVGARYPVTWLPRSFVDSNRISLENRMKGREKNEEGVSIR